MGCVGFEDGEEDWKEFVMAGNLHELRKRGNIYTRKEEAVPVLFWCVLVGNRKKIIVRRFLCNSRLLPRSLVS